MKTAGEIHTKDANQTHSLKETNRFEVLLISLYSVSQDPAFLALF